MEFEDINRTEYTVCCNDFIRHRFNTVPEKLFRELNQVGTAAKRPGGEMARGETSCSETLDHSFYVNGNVNDLIDDAVRNVKT